MSSSSSLSVASLCSRSSFSPDSSGPLSDDNFSANDDQSNSGTLLKPPPPPIPRPSRRKASSVSLSDSSLPIQPKKAQKVIKEVDEASLNKKRGKQQEQPKDEARKARNRASAERSRQRRLMYTASLEEKLAAAEEKNRVLEHRNGKMELLVKALASGQMKGADALSLIASSNWDSTDSVATQVNNTLPSFVAEPIPLDNEIFDTKMDINATASNDIINKNNNNNANTLTQVLSGSERSNFIYLYISWLSETLMLNVVLQIMLILMMMIQKAVLFIQTQPSKMISLLSMKKISLIGIWNLKMKRVHQVDKPKEPVMIIESWIFPKRIICNHRIK